MNVRWLVRMSVLLPGLILHAGNGWTGTLQQTLSAKASEEYVTNPLLIPADQSLSAWRSTVDPNYMLTDTLGEDVLNANLDLQMVRSSNTSIIANGDYPTATFGWKRTGEKSKFNISTAYSIAPTLMVVPGTIGQVSANSTSTSRNLSMDGSRELSEHTTLTLNGAYTYMVFSGSGNITGLFDYASQSDGIKLNYALSEHSATFVNLSYIDFVPTSGGPISRVYNTWLGLNWSSSESLDWTLQGGPSRMESPGNSAGTSASSTSLQGGGTMNYKGQRSNLALSANRQSTPSGFGAIIITDNVTGNLSYDLGERNKTGIDLGWSKYDYQTVSLYRTAGVWLRRDFNSSWWMKTYFNHNTSAWGGLSPAWSNLLGLSITYTNF